MATPTRRQGKNELPGWAYVLIALALSGAALIFAFTVHPARLPAKHTAITPTPSPAPTPPAKAVQSAPVVTVTAKPAQLTESEIKAWIAANQKDADTAQANIATGQAILKRRADAAQAIQAQEKKRKDEAARKHQEAVQKAQEEVRRANAALAQVRAGKG